MERKEGSLVDMWECFVEMAHEFKDSPLMLLAAGVMAYVVLVNPPTTDLMYGLMLLPIPVMSVVNPGKEEEDAASPGEEVLREAA